MRDPKLWRGVRAVTCGVLAVALLAVAIPVGASSRTSPVASVWVEPQSGYGFLDAAITSAHHSIDLSAYELKDPVIDDDLVASARRGVNVRVILNAAYEGASENAQAAAVLRAGSVHVVWAPSDQIFHAKYLVVDDTTAYIGTGNFVPSDYSSTRDFWLRDTQPADVAAVVATFSADFAHSGNVAHASGGLVWSPGATASLVTLISSARRSLLVENEEMNSAPIEDALISDARRGVDVDVVMSDDSEWTSALERLAAGGVHVRVLGATQIYIHAKILCVDCSTTSGTVFLGSQNFSTSSLAYNRELGVITSTLKVVRAVRSAVDTDFARGTAVRASTTPSAPSGASTGGVTITSLVPSVSPGSDETLRARSSHANDSCDLSVVLPSGYTSESEGLGPATADANGDVSWTWKIGTSTDPGTATATVTCRAGTATRTFTIT